MISITAKPGKKMRGVIGVTVPFKGQKSIPVDEAVVMHAHIIFMHWVATAYAPNYVLVLWIEK